MMTTKTNDKRNEFQLVSMEDLVPQEHLLRKIDKAIDWSFIYDLVQDKYSEDTGRPSIDPVELIKTAFIQYLYGIKSMRQTIKEIEVNIAYRWFLGIDLYEAVPHFSTFGKNYTRRFKDTDLFEEIFERILEECYRYNFVSPEEVFIDATHVKARANNKKAMRKKAEKEAQFYEKQLQKEINEDRLAHGKKAFEDLTDEDNEDDDTNSADNTDKRDRHEKHLSKQEEQKEERRIKCSTTDPESGWFHKGEHKDVFAYGIQTACDKNGWILSYTVNPGNEHDSRSFKGLYDKLTGKVKNIKTIIFDAAYKTPQIAKLLIDDGIIPVVPYKRPMTKDGFFRKYEFKYDAQQDCYFCPANHILKYSTTNKYGYREYKSNKHICAECPFLHKCTESKNHVKVLNRHIWESYMEQCEEIRLRKEMIVLYSQRKETVERQFGNAKENHGFRFTQMYGIAKMALKTALTYSSMNLKKLAFLLYKRNLITV